jgi:ATP adenylyltransferase
MELSYFADSDPDFHIADIGKSHRLIFNKYCTMRPQFLLCSKRRLPQLGYLDVSDFTAIWTVLHALGTSYVAMFSCGQSAGASINHRHVQFLKYPEGFKLLPDALDNTAFERAPFISFLERNMPPDGGHDAEIELKAIYDGFVQKTIQTLSWNNGGVVPHNVIVTKNWMFFIPRSKPSFGRAKTGAKGVVGMIWLYDKKELASWTSSGFLNTLAELGMRKRDDGSMKL